MRGLSGCLVALVGVVMASALQRLWLYQQQFGLTELRIYATGVVLWLAVVFVWLGVTVLRGRRHLFAIGAIVAGFAATLCINVVNPDALIARTNLDRPQVDVTYLGTLSDDALPALARAGFRRWIRPCGGRSRARSCNVRRHTRAGCRGTRRDVAVRHCSRRTS